METVRINDLVFVVVPDAAEAPERENSFSISKPKRKAGLRKSVSQLKLLLAVAKRRGWENVRKIGHGGMINQPIETNGWLVMPIAMYKGIIPPEAIQKIETLANIGIHVKGFLIADDQRHAAEQWNDVASQRPSNVIDWEKTANVLGKILAVTMIGAVIISLFPLFLAVGAIGAGIAYDPILIIVTDEDEWVSLYEWYH